MISNKKGYEMNFYVKSGETLVEESGPQKKSTPVSIFKFDDDLKYRVIFLAPL